MTVNKQRISLLGRMFTNGQGDRISISGRVLPKNKTLVHDAALLNTQHYKVRFNCKVKKSKERSSALLNSSLW